MPASTASVLPSQELAPACTLTRAGYECMFVGSDVSDEAARRALAMPRMQKLARAIVLPHFPDKPAYSNLARSIKRVYEECRHQIDEWKPDFVYHWNVISGRYARKIARRLGALTVFYMKAVVCDESAYRHGGRGLRYHLLRRKEIACVRKADRLLCISNKLNSWIRDNTGRSDAAVVPCCVDEEDFRFRLEARSRIRRRLGWSEDDPVAVWCGAIYPWQRVEETLSLLSGLQDIRPRLKVILLTGAVEQMKDLARQAGLEGGSYDVRRVPNIEMSDWLSCADVGIALREQGVLSRVSSPVKIAEYLACGLPVICNDGIGDLSEMIAAEDVGLIVNRIDDSAIRAAGDLLERATGERELRLRCRRVAEARLTWSAHMETFRRTFSAG